MRISVLLFECLIWVFQHWTYHKHIWHCRRLCCSRELAVCKCICLSRKEKTQQLKYWLPISFCCYDKLKNRHDFTRAHDFNPDETINISWEQDIGVLSAPRFPLNTWMTEGGEQLFCLKQMIFCCAVVIWLRPRQQSHKHKHTAWYSLTWMVLENTTRYLNNFHLL